MAHIIDGKKYDWSTSEELHSSGDGRALYPECGRLQIYRSPKGTVWGRLYYWVSETRDVEELAAADTAVRRLIQRARRPSALEDAFGPVEEG